MGIFLLVLPGVACAKTVTLGEVVQSTLDHYPVIRHSEAGLSVFQAREHTTAGYLLPSLTVQNQTDAGTVNAGYGGYFPLGVVPSITGGNTKSANSDLNTGNLSIAYLQWEFFDFGYKQSIKAAAAAGTSLARAQLEAEKYNAVQNAALTYFDWMAAVKISTILSDDVARLASVLVSVRSLVLNGLRPGVDTSEAAALLSEAKISKIRSEADVRICEAKLTEFTGLPLQGELPDTMLLYSEGNPNIDGKEPIDSVQFGHPLLQVFNASVEASKQTYRARLLKTLPKLGLSGAYWYRFSGLSASGFPANVDAGGLSLSMPYGSFNYMVGISATFDLFDIRHHRDLITESEKVADEQRAAIAGEVNTMNSLLHQVDARRDAAQKIALELPVGLLAARQAYGRQQALYKAGLGTLTDVREAEANLLRAETQAAANKADLLKLGYVHAALIGNGDAFLQRLNPKK